MRKIGFIVLMMIVMLGCKTTKHAVTDTDTKVDVQANVTDIKKVETTTTTQLEVETTILDSLFINESIVITELSLPDTAGKQYVLKTTEIQRNNKKITQLSKIDNTKQIKETKTVENKTDKSKIQAKEKIKNETNTMTKTKTPGWVYPVAVLLVLGVLGFVYLILKRYKII